MKFEKWHGLGNDFILVDQVEFRQLGLEPRQGAIQLCHRNFGIGADGLVLLKRVENAAAQVDMRIYNSDGSEAEMCGNAIRCVAVYARKHYGFSGTELLVQTKAGILNAEISTPADATVPVVRVNMGAPRLDCGQIPIALTKERCIEQPLELSDGRTVTITCVSMGNPHCVIFVPDVETWPVEELGPILERHRVFPQRTNVEFVSVLEDGALRMRVWERGAGITMACGTGACATLVAAHLAGKASRHAQVVLDGGRLTLEWDATTGHVFMTGPATFVFSGLFSQDSQATKGDESH